MDNLEKMKNEILPNLKPEYKSLKITKDLHRNLKVFCTQNNYKLMDYVEKVLNISMYNNSKNKIKELQENYDIEIVDNPNFLYKINENNSEFLACSTIYIPLEKYCEINKDKKIFLYFKDLPNIRVTSIEKFSDEYIEKLNIITKFQKEYDITITNSTIFEYNNKSYICSDHIGSLEEFFEENKDKKIFIYPNSLPIIKCVVIDKK